MGFSTITHFCIKQAWFNAVRKVAEFLDFFADLPIAKHYAFMKLL